MAGATVLALLAIAAPAAAQDDGVVVDPDSPSGKEYAIPLENERRLADPGTEPGAPTQQGARTSPLFGAGISGSGTSGAGSGASGSSAAHPDAPASKRSGGRARARSRSGPAAGAERPDTPAVVRAAAGNPGAPTGGIGTLLLIGAVGAGTLLVGGAAGLLLRRRANRS